MRARVPECVVWRIWWRGSDEEELRVPRSEDVGMCSRERSRCIVEGKWAVWKVDLWRRRVPVIESGSV
jgi:hypothetical protein